jgi:hypothetical protein
MAGWWLPDDSTLLGSEDGESGAGLKREEGERGCLFSVRESKEASFKEALYVF